MQDHPWRGLDLFNSGRFFDAHEVLEDLWREASPNADARRHLQGLVQLAVAFHHQSTGNRMGACSVLERALGNMHGAEESFPEIDWVGLRFSLEPWREYLAKYCNAEDCDTDASSPPPPSTPPPLPKVSLRDPEPEKLP